MARPVPVVSAGSDRGEPALRTRDGSVELALRAIVEGLREE
jgi:hypothetical protein